MTTIEHHNVSVLGTKVECSCPWSVDARAWGRQTARDLAIAHRLHPGLTTEMLLVLVGVGS